MDIQIPDMKVTQKSPFIDKCLLLEHQHSYQDVSQKVSVISNPMKQYNFVIDCYNQEENRVGSFTLQKMPENCCYDIFWKVMRNSCCLLLLELLILVPAIGIAIFLWVLICTYQYFRGLSVFNNNIKLVADPLQNMIFSPEICNEDNVTNKFLKISAKGI